MIAGLNKYDIILASRSPRRKHLLEGLDINFRVVYDEDIDESYPDQLTKTEIPVYLARNKASYYQNELTKNSILITADTIVWLNDKVLEKPASERDAFSILEMLSANAHEVITGVSIVSSDKKVAFQSLTKVWFRELAKWEIEYYIKTYKPYDKAGAYGIQEWIGYAGIEKIEGSYFNVMGLPVQQVYRQLLTFIN